MSSKGQCQLEASQITIIGTGLLGASVGLGLKAAGFKGRIVGTGRRRETVERAQRCGAVDVVSDDLAGSGGTGGSGGALADSELAIIAVPLGGFEMVLAKIAESDHDGLVITDVGSAKQCVADQARRLLPVPQRFIGSHPMAGSVQQGPDAAEADLFTGKPCIICPQSDSQPHALHMVKTLWQSLGMRLLTMSASEHDRQTALTSHLPHAAAVMLVEVAEQLGGWDVASTGFGDTTRLVASNPPMRSDIMLANRQQLSAALKAYCQQLGALGDIIERNDASALLELLTKNQAAHARWNSRQGEPGEPGEPS